MKCLLLFMVFMSGLPYCYAQCTDKSSINTSEIIYRAVDTEASFPTGEAGWRSFLENKSNPEVLIQHGAPTGNYTAVITFIVNKDGKISEIFCEKSPGYGVCEEGKRIIKLSRKWRPAMVNGLPVASIKSQPITI